MASIRVLFDTQAFRSQRIGGVSRYYVELIRRLPPLGVEPILHLPVVDNEHAAQAGLSSRRAQRLLMAHPNLRRVCSRALAVHDVVRSAVGDYEVFHRTLYARPFPVPRPCVCTVVDMIPEVFPQYFPRGNPHQRKRDVVRASDLVLSISESTTRDIIAIYGCAPEKIVTIPLGVDAPAFADPPAGERFHSPFPAPYILFVGMRLRYKNFQRFSQAAANVLAGHRDLALAVAGGGPLGESERAFFARAGVLERVVQADIPDASLSSVYRHAEVFVFPSEYEGFGLPILESFASGCPVAASRASSFPEVGGDAVEYFDPTSADDIAQAIERVLGSPARAAELRRKGSERALAFSWERTARQTAAAYRRLC